MSIQAGLYDYVTGLGTSIGPRFYPIGEVPAEEDIVRPYAIYSKIGNEHVRHLSGGSGIAAARFQLEIWSDSAKEAMDTADEVRAFMDNFSGAWGGVVVRAVFLEDDDDGTAPAMDGAPVSEQVTTLEFTIWYRETTTPAAA